LIETGTFLGDMLAAMRDSFDSLTSIELSEELYGRAQRRFAGDPKITLLQGDSKDLLTEVTGAMKEPGLFWLDAHYSGTWHEDFEETAGGDRPNPIFAELEAIFANDPRHAVLIDDARLFNGEEGWPPLADVCGFIREKEPSRDVLVSEDIVRILPR
jgi:hypothetical protein